MSRVRVMHYINQFFAGVGSEEKADVPVGLIGGAVGPGKRLQELLGDSAEIILTTYCGDNYFAPHSEDVLASISEIARDHNIEMLVAGPAFASGRHGFACIEVCHAASTSIGLYCVTGMHPENPGIERYKQCKDRKVFAFPTTEAVSGMEEALKKMAQCISKLAAGSTMGSASEEGYIPRGFRHQRLLRKSGTERAIEMLLDKVAGHPYTTEIPVECLQTIPVAPGITNLHDAGLALVTTVGITLPENPDGFKVYKNNQWRKYSFDKLKSMRDTKWDVVHGGYNTEFMKKNPNYGVPLDVCREMERDGVFGELYPYFYMTSGCSSLIPNMQDIGRQMVTDMKDEGIAVAILVST